MIANSASKVWQQISPGLAIRAQLIALLLLTFVTSSAPAALDPESKKPYQLRIVLQIAANRVFTPLFQEQVQRDVRNQLKLLFGDLGHIEVTRTHPLLRDIETKGLDPAIESWESLSELTTHFVLLDYAAGTYQIQTRFHDGMTGQPAPFTQRKQTNDRSAVAGTIVQWIGASFSPVGTVTAADGKKATLKLKGGDLGVPLNRWVKPGHVFAVSRIVEENGRPRAVRLEWALLEVQKLQPAGVCLCKYRHRYQEDALSEGPGTLGHRALHLPTMEGLVKVQLLDDTTLKPLDGVHVRVQHADTNKSVELITNRDGLATTRETFAHLALVEVLSGATVRAQFPVELIEGRTVVARVKIDTDRESLAPLEVRRDAWLRRAYDNLRMSSERSLELSGQLNQSLGAALESGRKSLPLLEAEIKYLEREQEQLRQAAKEKKQSYDLREGEQQIAELRTKAKDLQAFVQRIEGVLKDTAGDEKSLGLQKLLERARLLEREADFESAIRLYEQVVQASPEQAKIRAYLDQLKKAWTPKSEKHAEARKFIYQTWPALDVADLQAKIGEAKEALAACRDAGDRLTPQKLLRVNVTHTANLKKLLDTLKKRDSEDNRNQAKTVVQISRDLLRLHDEATAFVGARKE